MENIKVKSSKSDISESWLDKELLGSEFQDARLTKRFHFLVKQLWPHVGKPIPLACQDWSNTKAAYRFFSNDRVTEEIILQGHFQSTRQRFSSTTGPILVLQDTTAFCYKRERSDLVGLIGNVPKRKCMLSDKNPQSVCGILLHASLAITTEGLPLGLCATRFWTRKKFQGPHALSKLKNATRLPIETKESIRWLDNLKQSITLLGSPERCVHIGDRESDIYELFCEAYALDTHFLVRTSTNRLTGNGRQTTKSVMQEIKVAGQHRIEVRDKKGNKSLAIVEVKYQRIKILPPLAKQKKYPALIVSVIHAQEKGSPKNRERINWQLMTDLPITAMEDAIEKLHWYAMRWKIEVFHKILKSGCKAEESKLRTADRLTNLIAVFCILSWRIFWMTMINRESSSCSAKVALTKGEMYLLDKLVKNKAQGSSKKSLKDYLVKIAKLGGYLARASDPPPGNIVMWRGLARLTDIQLGFNLVTNICG